MDAQVILRQRTQRPEQYAFRDEVDTVIALCDRRRLKLYWLVLLSLCAMLCVPIWLTGYIPLVDYPNHLARMYILANYDLVPEFQRQFVRVAEPIPNLAMDLIVPPLARLMDIEIAGKVFLTLTVLLMAAGAHLLGRAVYGRPTWLALPAALISYSHFFLMGMLNFVFGLGMFAVTLALWLSYRQRWTAWRALAVSALVTASYLAHLSAYAFLGFTFVTLVGCDLYRQRRVTQGMIISLSTLVLPLICFFVFMGGTGEVGGTEWNTVYGKYQAVRWLTLTYNNYFDYGIQFAGLGLFLIAAGLLSRLQANRPLLLAAGVLFFLFLICPQTLFTSWGADARFVPAAALLALAALRFRLPRREATMILTLFLIIATFRLSAIWLTWRTLDRQIAAQVAMLDAVDDGARVYSLVFDRERAPTNRAEKTFRHTIYYATISHRTTSQTFFAIKGQQPLLFRHLPAKTNVARDLYPEEIDWDTIFDNYDYVWCYRIEPEFAACLERRCDRVEAHDGFLLYRVRNAVEPPQETSGS